MKLLEVILGAALLALVGCATSPDYGRPLADGARALLPLGPGEKLPDLSGQWGDREQILEALDRSLEYLRRPGSLKAYPIEGIEHGRVQASLERLKQLLLQSPNGQAFHAAALEEFEVFKSAGWDGLGGGVLFTGYYTPIFDGRKEPDSVFRYPLYGRPPDLVSQPDGTVLGMKSGDRHMPYPSRRTIESERILANRGLELAYLADPMDAYLCHVQGSAFIRLKNGELFKLGFGGTNGREYTSLAEVLVRAGEISEENRGVPALRAWAKAHPERLEKYTFENERYTFFTPITGTPHGSLDVPVTASRSLATDKTLFPRGAAVLVDTRVGLGLGGQDVPFLKLMFDQDTGGGIRTAGRGDIYLGIGEEAGRVAGTTRGEGQLYYLLLKSELVPKYMP
jgi:membrane-bound lytic murein transglycosylase A